jgi:hypothetical protein
MAKNPLAFRSINDATVAYNEDKRTLAAKGVILPATMKRYLTVDEKERGFNPASLRMGYDAQNGLPGPLSTDPNAALPWMLTSAIDPEIIRILFSPLEFADIIGERKVGTWTSQTWFFPYVESTGEVSSYDDFVNNGRAGANFNFPQLQSYLFQTILQYGELQVDRAGLAKINWVSELGLAAADLLNRSQNLSYAYGQAGLQNYGLLNNPNLSTALTPATKAWGGTGWFDNGSPAATANEVYNDVVALVTQLVSQTNGTLNIKSPMTLALSPQSEIGLTFTNSFGVNVEALLKKNYPSMKVKTAPQYGTQTTNNPQGYSAAGNYMQLIADKLQMQTVAYCAYNEKLRAHKIVPDLSSWKQKQTSGTFGTVLRTPAGSAQMLGI